MFCRPGVACRYFLRHQTTPGIEEWRLCGWEFPQRKAQNNAAHSLLIKDFVTTTFAKPSANSLFLCSASFLIFSGYGA
jgi:hypothetical protein